MSCSRKKGRKQKSDVNTNGRIIDSEQCQSKPSTPKNDLEENSMDDFDISATDNVRKQSLSSPFQNLVNAQSSGRKSQRRRQRTSQVDLNKNTGDPDDTHDLPHSKQRNNKDADWNESKVTDVDFVDSVVKDINLDDSDILAHGTEFLKASTPCSRKSQRTKRAMKWTDDFVIEKAVCTKSKRPRLSASEKMLDSTLETSDHQADVSVVSLPVVKGTRSVRRKKCDMLTDHEDLEASCEQESRDNLSVSISGNGSKLFDQKVCKKVKRQTNRRRSRKTSDTEQQLPLDESSMPEQSDSEENNKESSILLEEKECKKVKRQTNRRRSRKTSGTEQQLPLDESSMAEQSGSEENSKKFPCFHCEEVKNNASGLRTHMAAKHHRIWTSSCPEGKLDALGSCKMLKSIRCLKCDKLCNTFALYKNHIKWCGREEERVDCELCGKNVRVMSYDAHIRYMHKRKVEAEKARAERIANKMADLPATEVSSKTGRSLRRAAVKARSKLRELTTDLVPTSSSASYSKPQYICPHETFPADFMEKLHDKMKKLNKLTCCYQDCSSEHSEVSELLAHLLICSHKPNFVCNPEEFTCLACGDSFQLQSEVISHMTQHDWTTTQDLSNSESDASIFSSTDESCDDEDDDDDGEDEDGASDASDLSEGARRSKRKKKKRRMLFLSMASFLQQHCWSNLFPNWEAKQCLYKPLPASEESHYLPQNPGLAVKIQTSETEFSRTVKLDLFETYLYNDSYNINVGGPVWALAWSPVPPDGPTDQYLALYTHRTADETHLVNECSNETALIQLWRFQLHDQKEPESERPEMIGGLLLDCGPIWEMKWCPTGSWNEGSAENGQNLSRIGLLAIASHSGDVHILSVPKCFSVSSERQDVKLYRATPVATLKRRGRDGICPCLCLDWHWKEQCGMLMAGFADGTTSLWDLNITSSLLRLKAEDGRDWLFPFQSIRSHVWPVKGVAFCQSQLNLIVTCSADRLVKLWDLTEPECPLTIYHNTLNTGVIWPINSTSTFTCSGDECYLCEHNGTILCSYATNKLLTRPLTIHNASVWGMSYNCWLHCLVSCDSVGVVVKVPWIAINQKTISDSRQVLFLVEMRDGSAEVANCQMPLSLDVKTEATENDFGTTNSNGCHEVLEAAGQNSNDACECSCRSNQTAESCENSKSHLVTDCKHCQLQRCLLFKDFSLEWQFSNTPLFFAKQMPADDIHNSLPCSLNRIVWNTNYGFHKWLATGGQAGILRVKLIEGIERQHSKKKTKRKIHKRR